MKIIYNNIIPFPGFSAINLFGVLFARKGARINDVTINHESIHTAQMKELLFIGFYLWYFLEWFIRLAMYVDAYKAYRNISFEREAYMNELDLNYLQSRNKYSFLKYMRK